MIPVTLLYTERDQRAALRFSQGHNDAHARATAVAQLLGAGCLALILLSIWLTGCGELVTSPAAAKRAAEASGLTEVRVLARHGVVPQLYGCSKHDDAAYEVQGVNPAHRGVSITVCCGWPLRGCRVHVP